MNFDIRYRCDIVPPIGTIASLYRDASLNRPVDDLPRLEKIFAGSNVIHSAWEGERLVGILRGWTDHGRDGYICDLAVLPEHQRKGIGRHLLERVIAAHPQVQFVLRASHIARDYYRHIGWHPIENGWFVPRRE